MIKKMSRIKKAFRLHDLIKGLKIIVTNRTVSFPANSSPYPGPDG